MSIYVFALFRLVCSDLAVRLVDFFLETKFCSQRGRTVLYLTPKLRRVITDRLGQCLGFITDQTSNSGS